MVGWQQILLVLLLAVLLFGGRGKISSIMADMAKGIKSFRKGLADDDDETTAASSSPSSLPHTKDATPAQAPADSAATVEATAEAKPKSDSA